MGVVIAIFFVAAARYIFGHPAGPRLLHPAVLRSPDLEHASGVWAARRIAVLTYIGFDGISTLSEEAENPRRNILLATVLTCLVIGILSAVEVYAAQLVWPASRSLSQRGHRLHLRCRTRLAAACSRSWDSPWWWPTSVPAWEHNSAPPGCFTAWDAATPCPSHSSAQSIPNGTYPATT